MNSFLKMRKLTITQCTMSYDYSNHYHYQLSHKNMWPVFIVYSYCEWMGDHNYTQYEWLFFEGLNFCGLESLHNFMGSYFCGI